MLGSFPHRAHAQGLISIGAGIGGGFGDRNNNGSGGGVNGLVYAQVHPPLIPFAVRGDALLTHGGSTSETLISATVNAVVLAPLPFVVPYALAGFGKYGIGKDGSQTGWNVGVGVRARLPNFAIFGEVRRHQRISRDLFTIGLSR